MTTTAATTASGPWWETDTAEAMRSRLAPLPDEEIRAAHAALRVVEETIREQITDGRANGRNKVWIASAKAAAEKASARRAIIGREITARQAAAGGRGSKADRHIERVRREQLLSKARKAAKRGEIKEALLALIEFLSPAEQATEAP